MLHKVELANPNPEFLIKSIAEQGYSLETALADLIDNSISAGAKRIEILTNSDSQPFELFLADDGDGMDLDSLKRNLQFPSQSPEENRRTSDLGRFGLGLKTASFSQTRKFTVLSRKKGDKDFNALTWDVNHLRESNKWEIIINSQEEVKNLIEKYLTLSSQHLEYASDFQPNTIVVWEELYKFENYLDQNNRKTAFDEEITKNTTEYLSIVFHRFLEFQNYSLKIRINNILVNPFNPFRTDDSRLRVLETKHKQFGENTIKIQGFVLPNSSISESKSGISKWTPLNKSLLDMEGIYVYRANRLILFGGWNNLVKKSSRMQLARLRVEIGNGSDHFFHLNVAKSKITIPHDLKISFLRQISELLVEAKKEYYNNVITKFPQKSKINQIELFSKYATNKGVLMEFNDNFILLKSLRESLDNNQKYRLNFILKATISFINKLRNIENVELVEKDSLDQHSVDDISNSIKELLKAGISKEIILKDILPNLGLSKIPDEITVLLK